MNETLYYYGSIEKYHGATVTDLVAAPYYRHLDDGSPMVYVRLQNGLDVEYIICRRSSLAASRPEEG